MLHYIHHLGDMKSNLAMVNMGMDGLFSSMQVDDPMRKRKDKETGAIVRQTTGLSPDDYPQGLTESMLNKIRDAAGLQAAALGFDVDLDIKVAGRTNATNRGYPTVLLRLMLLALAVKTWFVSEQALLNSMRLHDESAPVAVSLADAGHRLAEPLTKFLVDNKLVPLACTISCFAHELATLILIVRGVLGKTFRPLLALTGALTIRLALRLTTQLISSPDALWEVPADLPGLFRQAATSNVFFSARMALATIFVCEAIYTSRKALGQPCSLRLLSKHLVCAFSICLFLYTIALSLALRASWSFDLIVAILISRLCTIFAYRFAPFLDKIMP